MEMEEDRIMKVCHQEVQKSRDKSWHDRYIKKKIFNEGDLVLLYDKKFLEYPGNFRMHWLETYEVETIPDGGSLQLKDLGGT
jgi:hypothetical protein